MANLRFQCNRKLIQDWLNLPPGAYLDGIEQSEDDPNLMLVAISGDSLPDFQGAVVKAQITRFIPDDPQQPPRLVWEFLPLEQ